MIRTHTSLTVLTAALIAAPLYAAPVPKSDGADVDKLLARVRVSNVGGMLAQPTVAKAIALTDEQKKKIDGLTDDMVTKAKAKYAAAKQFANAGAEMNAMLGTFGAIGEMNTAFDSEVTELLTSEQLRRLRQIQLQREGPTALLSRHGMRALNPTVEQEDKLSAELAKWKKVPMFDEIVAAASGALGATGGEADVINAVLKQYAEDTDAVREAMLKVLTAEQRAMWSKMVGDSIPQRELLLAGSPFGDGKLVTGIMEASAVPAPPPVVQAVPVVVPAGGVPPPRLPPPAVPPPPVPSRPQ